MTASLFLCMLALFGPVPGIESGELPVEGGKLFFQRAGQGETVILIHDGLIHHEIWDSQFEVLAEYYEVIRYDRRGYGKSSQPRQPYSNEKDLLDLFRQLQIDQAFLVGMSAGGGLAVDFTLAYPEKVKGLVLVGAVVSGFGYTEHFYTRGGRVTSEDIADLVASRRYWYTEDPYEVAPQNKAARERFGRLVEANLQNLDSAKYRLRIPPARPALGALSEIHVPVLIVAGESDIPDVHAHAGAMTGGIPDARRMVLSGAGHLVPMEKPEAFNALMLAFLREVQFIDLVEADKTTQAIRLLQALRTKNPSAPLFPELAMNQRGYDYLQSGRIDEALGIFNLNVAAYPDSANAYDSLAEAYMNKGNKSLAIENYRKSLKLNPGNSNAEAMLKKLGCGK